MSFEHISSLAFGVVAGIALPLLVGYAVQLDAKKWARMLSRCLHLVISGLIILMGVLFGVEPDIQRMLVSIGWNGALFFIVLTAANLGGLFLYVFVKTLRNKVSAGKGRAEHSVAEPRLVQVSLWRRMLKIVSELQILLVLGIGYYIGLWGADRPYFSVESVHLGTYALLGAMLFLIGVELRMQKIPLVGAFFNLKGVVIACVVVMSSSVAAFAIYGLSFLGGDSGVVPGMIEMSLRDSFVVTSGFGWYSLSGVLATQKAGPYIGGLVFSLDLARELLVIVFLPLLARIASSVGTGYCGATAMDVTLPFLKKAYGADVVPLALSSGLILSLASPLIISLLLAG